MILISESGDSNSRQTWYSYSLSSGRTCKGQAGIPGRVYICTWQYIKCKESVRGKIQTVGGQA